MSLTLPITPSTLPQGFCPADYQEMWNGYASHGSVVIPSGSLGGVQVSATVPTDQERPWLQLDAFGRPVRLYWFAGGSWLSLHPMVSGLTLWWFDFMDATTIKTFDGGDATAPSDTTGPMWQFAKNDDGVEIAAMFPIAPGTLPSTTVLAQGDTGGAEEVILTAAQANHFHGIGDSITNAFAKWCTRAWSAIASVGTATQSLVQSNWGPDAAIASGSLGTSDALTSPTASTPHNNMPPYVVGYLLQRTPRLYYSV